MKPIIRFRRYNKEWHPFKLNTILIPSNEKNTKGLYGKNDVLSVSGEVGIVNQIAFQGRSFAGASVLNYGVVNTNEIVYTKSPLRNNPYGIIKTNNGPSGIVSTLYAIYNCCEKSCPQFVETYFTLSSRTNNYLRPLVRKGAKNDMKVSSEGALLGDVIFPCKDEQIEIASYFRTLDAKLQASTKKVESLKKLKAASLISMFPQQGGTIPKVRFKGFEGEWSTSILGSIFAERIESNENGEMLSVTMNNGIIRSSENGRFDNSNSDKSKYKVVKIGDIAYNSMRMWQGASGVSQYEGIVSPAYTVVTPRIDVDTDFFGYLFKTDDVIRLFKLNSQGLTSDNWNLKYPAFSRICVSYPKSKEEQQAIATFFRSLDRKIALETARLEKLKQIKLACLDKMFV